MAEYAYAEGLLCYYCGHGRCRCPELEALEEERARMAHRTWRLMRAIELAETLIEGLEEVHEFHPALPEIRERRDNLTKALLTHRRAVHNLEK